MMELTEEEFTDRMMAIQRARKIFITSGLTTNISIAFSLYQEVFAERERELFLGSQNKKVPRLMDRYDRPKCPECSADMMFRKVPENKEGINVQLVCSNKECDVVLNSENDLQWWMEKLKVKV